MRRIRWANSSSVMGAFSGALSIWSLSASHSLARAVSFWAATAYTYAKRWLALAPDDPDAQKLVRDCEKYLEEEKALEMDWKEREEIIRKETPDDAKGVNCK